MFRKLLFVGLCWALAAGCGKPAADAPPAGAPTAPAAEKSSGQTNETLRSDKPAKQEAVQVAPPASRSSPTSARDIAARLLESDGEGGWRTNEKAATELEKLGSEAIAQLWQLLKDSSADVRRGAAYQLLGEFNPAEREQVAAMSALLDDSDRTVRGVGLSAVKQMPLADQTAAVPRLAKMLAPDRESQAGNRAAIARLIGTLKQEGAAGLPALVAAAANDPETSVRAASLMAISQIAAPEQAITPLVKGLADKDMSPRLVEIGRAHV